jgi:hypothetical protein
MQTIIAQLTSFEAVLVGVVVISWVAVALALVSLVKVKRQEAIVHDAMQELKRTVDIGNSGLMGMGRKLLSIEKNMQRSKRQTSAISVSAPPAHGLAPNSSDQGQYQQVGEMLAQGLSVSQVASATGMSQAEVSLLAMLKQAALAETT